MPRQAAPPPSGEFSVRLSKPFSAGPPTHTVEVIGELNGAATVKVTREDGNSRLSEKTGNVPRDDVKELITLVSTLRGFPSHPSQDVYGLDTKVNFNTFEIQWSNEDEDSTAGDINEIAAEQKEDLKRIIDSIEALGRTFAKENVSV